jgi:hypothetical protein
LQGRANGSNACWDTADYEFFIFFGRVGVTLCFIKRLFGFNEIKEYFDERLFYSDERLFHFHQTVS